MNIDQLLEQLDVTPENLYLSVYTESQHYGGPEEGGWWYNWYDYHGSKRFESREAAEAARDAIAVLIKEKNNAAASARHQAMANMPEGESPYLDTEGYIPTGWTDGGEYILVIEDQAGELAQNQKRPYYE